MTVIHSQKLPVEFKIEVESIEQEVSQLSSEQWLLHVNTGVYEGKWEVLPLRCQASSAQAHPILQAFNIEQGEDWVDLPAMENLPSIAAVLTQLKCSLNAVRLMRLQPQANIAPHRDGGLAIEYGEARLHIPLETNDDVAFYSNGAQLPMKFAELWYVNADQEHAVYNRGNAARINLVVDCVVNDWLLGLVNSA
jgi:hypothetical protein